MQFISGRKLAPDIRDGQYRFSVARAKLTPFTKTTGTKLWSTTGHQLPLDQGPTPHCVGFSLASLIIAGPVRTKEKDPQEFAENIYWEALKIDEWPGEADEGTSVRAGSKVLQNLGYFPNYIWSEKSQDTKLWLLNIGPVVNGTEWPDSMMEKDSQEALWIDPAGQSAGGHAYCYIGVNTKKKLKNPYTGQIEVGAYRLCQTWGDWGMAWVPFSVHDQLQLSGGETVLPTEVKLKL